MKSKTTTSAVTALGLALLLMMQAGPALSKGKPQFVDVIVQYDALPGNGEVARVGRLGGQINRRFQRLPMLAMRMPINSLQGLAAGKGVRTVSLDEPVEGSSASARATANVPTPGSPGYVYPASHVAVAVLDSGVSDHWDVSPTLRVDIIPAFQGGVNVRDEFNSKSFSGSDGTASWSGDWQEVGESNGPVNGAIKVRSPQGFSCPNTECLIVGADRSTNRSVTREADLSGAVSASLHR